MKYEFEGKNEKEAIEIAANELGLERDQFDVEILESLGLEVLDLDAYTGGFNLQIAWSTGWLAGRSAAEK